MIQGKRSKMFQDFRETVTGPRFEKTAHLSTEEGLSVVRSWLFELLDEQIISFAQSNLSVILNSIPRT